MSKTWVSFTAKLLIAQYQTHHGFRIVVDANDISSEISALVAFGGRALRVEVEATSRQIADLKADPDGQAKLAAWKTEKERERLDRQRVSSTTKLNAIMSNFLGLARS